MKPWLFVGAKVVCVDVSVPSGRPITDIVEGGIYTVRRVGMHECRPFYGPELCVWLDGIVRPDMFEPDCPFSPRRFRPLIDTTQTVAAMRKLMQKARDEKRVTVSA